MARTADEDLLKIADAVRDFVTGEGDRIAPGYRLKAWGDESVDVRDRLQMLTENGIQGATIVFILLALFLDIRLAFWVAMGIPISVFGAGIVLLATGQSMNMLSMFAFLMAIGIVVDDGNVIGENVYSHRLMLVLAIIPFGIIGAVFGHALMGLPITLFSMFGLVSLTGVVVNDSIVLLDFINLQIRSGMPLHEALMMAGRRRLRPVFLTSITTVAGLLPILVEESLQTQVLIPMATSLAFGLIMSTLLVLFLVPNLYYFYIQIVSLFGFEVTGRETLDQHATPSTRASELAHHLN